MFQKRKIVMFVAAWVALALGAIAVDHHIGFTAWYGHLSYPKKVGVSLMSAVGGVALGAGGSWVAWRLSKMGAK